MEAIPDLTFFTGARMAQFWEYVKALLEVVAIPVLIVVAIVAVGYLLGIIVNAFQATEKKKDKDDDYEYREY